MAKSNAERQKKWRETTKAREEAEILASTPLEIPEHVAAWQQEFVWKDKTGAGRYKSETRSLPRLYRLFCGRAETQELEDAEREARKKSPNRAWRRPDPSTTTIQLPNVDLDIDNPPLDYNQVLTFEQWLELRDKARKDLFWLGKAVLGKGLYKSVHQTVCDQFVQKNFDGMYHDTYSLDDFHDMIGAQKRLDENGVDTRESLILDSRGFYKSTIDGIDCVQWLLNCPDVRIFIVTGEFKLAVSFLSEIKGYFYLADGAEPKPLHLLFPEYVLTGVAGTSDQPLECPARVHHQKEASLWVNAIVANLSGWHCDIKKGDDVVTDENSNTEDAREKLKVKFDGTDDLLDPHGFSDNLGTRYFTDDWYGMRLTPPEEEKEISPVKYFCRGCWTVKPEYADVPLLQLKEEMVVLTFPQKWTFRKLRNRLLKKGERHFKNQQLNQPTDAVDDAGFKLHFSLDALRAHSYPKDSAPQIGDIFISWDWSYSAKKTSDYSAGVVARVVPTKEEGVFALSILEIVYGKWKASELAFQIIALDKKWMPKKTMIEAALGAELLQLEIQRQAARYGITSLDIFWKPISTDDNAKRNRIKSLETLLNDDRLWFVNGAWIDETFKQLTQYTGERKNRGRKDDIPDALSYICYFLPRTSLRAGQIDPEVEEKMREKEEKDRRRKANYERIFNTYAPSKPEPPPAPPAAQEVDPRRAMMNRFFGGNGMRA